MGCGTASLGKMAIDLSHRCWVEIDLKILAENVKRIRNHLPANVTYISVVKADGYGLGAIGLLPTLRSSGAGIFAVASVAEGIEIRKHEPELPILLLSATLPDEEEAVFEHKLTPSLSCPEEIFRYNALAQRLGRKLPVHLIFDTGMGRLGNWHPQANTVFNALSKAPSLEIHGFYSHFASAGDDPEFTKLQRKRLQEIFRKFHPKAPNILFHIDNSAGLATFDSHAGFNAARIGILQYGIRTNPEPAADRFDLLPVVSFHSRISLVKTLPKGASISYGRTYTLQRDSRIAVIPAGYADGISRFSSNRGQVLVRGRRAPILGQVTMDNFMIDITDIPDAACGDRVTLIGRQETEEISINEYSAAAESIPWESLCAFGKRVTRKYLS